MPICPGCEQQIPYSRLAIHVRYCERIGGTDRGGGAANERFDVRLTGVEERVEQRLREIDRRLARAEQLREDARATSRE